MAILPGSLDYLYHYGILDHIPYEAYEQLPMTQSGMAQMSGIAANPYQVGNFNNKQYFQNNNLYQTNTYGDFRNANYQNPQNRINNSLGNTYLDNAQQGELYKTYTQDMFVPFSQNSYANGGLKTPEDNFRQSILDSAVKAKDSIMNAPTLVKGLLAGGVMITTLALLFKGRKSSSTLTSEGSKWNPLNWFRK